MLGLTDAHIGRRVMPRREGALGHQKHDAAYVLGRAPELLIPGFPRLTGRPLLPADIAPWFSHWFNFVPGDRELLQTAAFWEQYAVKSVPVAQDRWLTLFLRQ